MGMTPADTPSSPSGYAEVTPHGRGPAPYDINAPQDIAGIQAAFNAANDLAGAGVLFPKGPRQREAQAILESPQGADSSNVLAGFPDYENNNITPPPLVNPIHGAGDYPGTTQAVPQYGVGGGVEGVSPDSGSMGQGAGLGYPGTTQDGVPKYGTSG